MIDPAIMDRPTSAGMYDAYLGGTVHSRVDQTAAEQVERVFPQVVDTAWANRGFLQRAVRAMAADWGIRQFVDIGSGLPTARNTHDVVREAIPDGRVVYVDIDPLAVARSTELLAGVAGVTAIEGDVRQPLAILGHPETRRLIDLTEPVGLLLVTVLAFVPDDDDPWSLAARYVDALAPGSYLALTHGSGDHWSDDVRDAVLKLYAATDTPPTERTRTEIERFFDGLEIVSPYQGAPPAVTFAGLWGADQPDAADSEGSRLMYAAVGRKP